jgi:YidC/Oxa1 family membrane protein insertase
MRFVNPEQRTIMKLMMYIMMPLGCIFTMRLDAAVQWYFLGSALLQYIQNWAFHNPAFRRWNNLPELREGGNPNEPSPFANLRELSTTAKVEKSSNPIQSFKSAVSGVKDQANDYMESRKAGADARRRQQAAEKRGVEDAAKPLTPAQHKAMFKRAVNKR